MPSSNPRNPASGSSHCLRRRPRRPTKGDRAACEPRSAQLRQCRLAHDQRAGSCRVSEHLVERDRHVVWPPAAQVQRIGRHECRRVEQYVPAPALATSIQSSGCWTPLKLDCAGYANNLSPKVGLSSRRSSEHASRRRPGRMGAYATSAPARWANSRIPFTELWLSTVSTKRESHENGYDSATSFSAPVALLVKTTSYVRARLKEPQDGAPRLFGELRHQRRRRVPRVRIPNTLCVSKSICARSWDSAYTLAPVVQVGVLLLVEAAVLARPQRIDVPRRGVRGIPPAEFGSADSASFSRCAASIRVTTLCMRRHGRRCEPFHTSPVKPSYSSAVLARPEIVRQAAAPRSGVAYQLAQPPQPGFLGHRERTPRHDRICARRRLVVRL